MGAVTVGWAAVARRAGIPRPSGAIWPCTSATFVLQQRSALGKVALHTHILRVIPNRWPGRQRSDAVQLAKVALQHRRRWAGLIAGVVFWTQQIQGCLGIQARALVQMSVTGGDSCARAPGCQRELLVGLHAHAGDCITTPSTLTAPFSMCSSASRREQPSCAARRLAKRSPSPSAVGSAAGCGGLQSLPGSWPRMRSTCANSERCATGHRRGGTSA